MIRYLAESEKFKVYSMYESVYLKDKSTAKNLNDFEDEDVCIADHYGDPNDALVLPNEKFIVVSGCGLSIYDIANNKGHRILDDPNQITWTNALHQEGQDDPDREVRFVSLNPQDQLRVFKIDLLSREITEME